MLAERGERGSETLGARLQALPGSDSAIAAKKQPQAESGHTYCALRMRIRQTGWRTKPPVSLPAAPPSLTGPNQPHAAFGAHASASRLSCSFSLFSRIGGPRDPPKTEKALPRRNQRFLHWKAPAGRKTQPQMTKSRGRMWPCDLSVCRWWLMTSDRHCHAQAAHAGAAIGLLRILMYQNTSHWRRSSVLRRALRHSQPPAQRQSA